MTRKRKGSKDAKLLADQDFSDSDLSQSDFSGFTITDCDFIDTHLNNSNFSGARISDCDFSDASLEQCDFSHTEISDCFFSGADLEGSCFSGAVIIDCYFDDANLEDCIDLEFDSEDEALEEAVPFVLQSGVVQGGTVRGGITNGSITIGGDTYFAEQNNFSFGPSIGSQAVDMGWFRLETHVENRGVIVRSNGSLGGRYDSRIADIVNEDGLLRLESVGNGRIRVSLHLVVAGELQRQWETMLEPQHSLNVPEGVLYNQFV